MSRNPSGAEPDPMDRVVDRLLSQIGQGGPQLATGPVSVVRESPATGSRRYFAPSGNGSEPDSFLGVRGDAIALWSRVVLGVALGVLMTQWPYRNDCGTPLLLYLGAVVVVMMTGGWVALTSWKQRSGLAHVIALFLIYWGAVLAAEQLLPRIGYSAERASWVCPIATLAR